MATERSLSGTSLYSADEGTLFFNLFTRTTTIFCCGLPDADAELVVLAYGEPWPRLLMTVAETFVTLVFEPLLLCTRAAMCGCVAPAVEARRAGGMPSPEIIQDVQTSENPLTNLRLVVSGRYNARESCEDSRLERVAGQRARRAY